MKLQGEALNLGLKSHDDSQLMDHEPRVTDQAWRLWERTDDQADQPVENAWHAVEKMEDELGSLLEERVRERYQTGITRGDDSKIKGLQPPSTILEGPLKSPRLDLPGGVSSNNVSGFSQKMTGKEDEPSKNSPPASRFFPIDALKDSI